MRSYFQRRNYTYPLEGIARLSWAVLDAEAMQAVIARALSEQGRGSQTRLAQRVGVTPQTVNKWVKGQTAPEMERWPDIELALGLELGTLATAAGFRSLTTFGAQFISDGEEEYRISITPPDPDPDDDLESPDIPAAVADAIRVLGVEIRKLQSELDELRSEVRGPRRSSDPAPPTPNPTDSARQS